MQHSAIRCSSSFRVSSGKSLQSVTVSFSASSSVMVRFWETHNSKAWWYCVHQMKGTHKYAQMNLGLCVAEKMCDKQVPFWLLPVTQQPCHTGNVWWRSQSSVRGGLGPSFRSDLQPSAEVQRTVVWKMPTPKPWRHNQPRKEKKNKTHIPVCSGADRKVWRYGEILPSCGISGKVQTCSIVTPCGRVQLRGPCGCLSPHSNRRPPSCPQGYLAEPGSSAGHPDHSPVQTHFWVGV